MSAIEYTKCDGKDCEAVTPDNPCEVAWDAFLGWGSLTVAGVSYDLCPECAKKAMDAVGVRKWKSRNPARSAEGKQSNQTLKMAIASTG